MLEEFQLIQVNSFEVSFNGTDLFLKLFEN